MNLSISDGRPVSSAVIVVCPISFTFAPKPLIVLSTAVRWLFNGVNLYEQELGGYKARFIELYHLYYVLKL